MAIPDFQTLMRPLLDSILIDGPRLARLMFDHGVGVATVSNYEVRRIDSDYFAD